MARTVTRPTLTDVLVLQGILPKQTLDQVLSRLGGVTAAFGQTLVSEGILSEDQLAHALTRLAGDEGLREDMISRGRARVPRFTWDSAVAQTWAVYEKVMGASS